MLTYSKDSLWSMKTRKFSRWGNQSGDPDWGILRIKWSRYLEGDKGAQAQVGMSVG